MNNKNSKKPFFAKFLENQVKNLKDIKGGNGTVVTNQMKESNSATNPRMDTVVTMKYPSDSDEARDEY